MDIIGLIIVIVGGLLFYGSKIIYKNKEKKLNNKDEAALVDKSILLARTMGALLVVIGGIFILFW